MRLPVVVAIALALTACEKQESGSGKKATADVKSGEVGPDGVRRIAIEAGKGGYKPARIEARPGESLILVFTRTAEGECLSQIKVADGEVKELPMNQPVEIPVTAPKSGELAFACGMDMFGGVIAVSES
jgi:plastocyanin domain-containing protein